MKTLTAVASIVALFAVSASATPVPHTQDRLTRPDLADESQKADTKVNSRLHAKEGWMGPTTGPLVAADPPHSPEGKLQVYVDCSPLGVEQLEALERAGLTVDGVEPSQGRVRGSIEAAKLDEVAKFWWVQAVRPVDLA